MCTPIPPIPDWNKDNKFNYEDTFLDSNDFDTLNNKLISIGLSLKNINMKLSTHEKTKALLDVEYKRK